MWVRRGDGQEFARLEGKENDENIYYCNPGRGGCNRVGARIQSTNWSAKTRASDGHATANVTTTRRRGSRSAGISTWWQPAPDAESVGAGALRHMGREHVVRSESPRKMERH